MGWNLQEGMGNGQDGVGTQSYYCSKSQVIMAGKRVGRERRDGVV